MIAAALLALPLCPSLPVPTQDVVAKVKLEPRSAAGNAPRPVGPLFKTMEVSSLAPAGAPALPEELFEASWGKVELGSKTVHVALGKASPDAETLELAFADLNGDGAFGDGERIGLEPASRELNDGSTMWSQDISGLELRLGDAPQAVELGYYVHPTRGVGARLVLLGWHGADVQVDGQTVSVAMLDLDHDGCIGGEVDRWFLYPSGAPPERPATDYALSALNEGRFHDGRRYTVKMTGCADATVTAAPAEGPDPRDLAHHRERIEKLWFERFDAERESFVEQRELDTTRPRAEKPIDWRYVSFDEAIALGEKLGKPVFIDVMAFWCVWCYRMDYYTYVDAEVAKVLNEEFVPVKILQEQQVVDGDYDLAMREKLEARGIPAMGIFDAKGDVLHKIGGWKKPTEFLEDLRAGLEAYRGAKN